MSEQRILCKYEEDFGRMGDLESVFITTREELERIKKREDLYLNDVLGKHSEIQIELTDENCKIVSEDQEFIDKLQAILSPEYEVISGVDFLCLFHEMEDCDKETAKS